MELQKLDAQLQDLTPHQMKLVQALYDAGEDWLTRSKVAKAIDKRRLTPYDIECLQLLTDYCLIEMSTQPTTAPGSDFAYIYHMPDAVASALQEWSDNRDDTAQSQARKPINITDE